MMFVAQRRDGIAQARIVSGLAVQNDADAGHDP
jgi:hypothetical protein